MSRAAAIASPGGPPQVQSAFRAAERLTHPGFSARHILEQPARNRARTQPGLAGTTIVRVLLVRPAAGAHRFSARRSPTA